MSGSKVVVIDCGSMLTKVGFAGDDAPKSIFPTLYGKSPDGSDEYVGKEAMAKKSVLSVYYPVQQGIVHNFDQLEKILRHVFEGELGVQPDQYPVIFTESADCPSAMRERLAKLLLDGLNVPAVAFASQARLTLNLASLGNAVVLDIIDDVSFATAFKNGTAERESVSKTSVGASAVTNYLAKLLSQYGPVPRDELKALKKQFCYVATSDEAPSTESFDLKNGEAIKVGGERTKCYEILFDSSVSGASGIQEILFDAISKASADVQSDLYANIVVTGGASTTKGLVERVKKEIAARAPAGTEVNVSLSSDPAHSAWRAASTLAAGAGLTEILVTKEEFAAQPSVFNSKCLV